MFNLGDYKDLTGQVYGRLTVMYLTDMLTKDKRRIWHCKCSCGNEKDICEHNLWQTKSCGCLHVERAKRLNYKHGLGGKEKLYNVWSSMRDRCLNPKCKDYRYYGGRGISIDPSWNDYLVFRKWAYNNGYSEDAKLSIDRIDVNGNYCEKNCRWATRLIQANNMSSNHKIEFNGESHTIAEWARIVGIKFGTLSNRLRLGWSVEKSLTTPVRGNTYG